MHGHFDLYDGVIRGIVFVNVLAHNHNTYIIAKRYTRHGRPLPILLSDDIPHYTAREYDHHVHACPAQPWEETRRKRDLRGSGEDHEEEGGEEHWREQMLLGMSGCSTNWMEAIRAIPNEIRAKLLCKHFGF